MRQSFLFFTFLFLLLASYSHAADKKPKTFTQNIIGNTSTYETLYEDTLVELAVKKDVGYVELLAANPGIDPWLPGKGQKITIPNQHILPSETKEGILINLGEMRLYYFPPDGKEPITYPIGIGRDGLSTPTGETFIRNKIDGPKWRPTPRMREENPDLPKVVDSGEDNPLGTHALYLNWPAYLIHGTQKPTGIGRRVSSGCIRMYPKDIIWMYDNIATQTKVTVVNEPIKMAWIDGDFYIEAQPDSEQIDQIEYYSAIQAPKISNDDLTKIKEKIGKNEHKINWPLVRKVLLERSGVPTNVMKKEQKERA